MPRINVDKASVNSMYSEDIIAVLQNMINDELTKDDEKVNTDFVDECVNALLEIEQDRDKTFAAIVPLFSKSDYLDIIGKKRSYFSRLNKTARAALVAAAVAATTITVNAAVEGITGVNLLREAGSRIQQTLDSWSGKNDEGIEQDVDNEGFGSEESTTAPVSESTTEETETTEPTSENTTENTSVTESTTNNNPTRSTTNNEQPTQSTTEKEPSSADEETTKQTTTETTTKRPRPYNTTTEAEPVIDDGEPSKPEKVTLKSLEASFDNFKFDYIYGESLSYDGLTLSAVYSNGTKKPVSLSDCDYTQSLNMNTTADYTLRVIYETCVVKIPITVRPDEETRGSEKCSNDDFDYLLTDKGAYITKYKGSSKHLDLTDIDGNSAYAIAADVFKDSDIITVYAPSVKKIFRNAFKNSKALSTADFENAEYIGESAFEGCEALESPSMSENATQLGKSAYKNSGIRSITVPSTLESVPASLCEGCSRLESVNLSNATAVENSAFEDCTALESITGLGAVKKIGSFAFYGDELAQIDEAPSALESVGDSALAYCKKMEIKALPSTVKEIGEYSFMYVTKLEKAEIPNGITKIPAGAFWGAHIKTLTLPDGLKAIEQAAFMSTVIKEVTIPESVERIESRGLYTLSKLKVTFEGSPDYIDESAFYSYRYLTFLARRDTTPIAYAEEHDIEYEIIE